MRTLIEVLLTGAVLLLWLSATSAAYEATPSSRAAAAAPASAPARAAAGTVEPAAPARASRGEPATLCACASLRAASGGAAWA